MSKASHADRESPQSGETLTLVLPDEAATGRLGAQLLGLAGPGEAIFLAGGLGAGKTALARAFIRALLPGEEVPSPTFTLVQTYIGPEFEIVHYDLYRVESPDEVWELGWAEAGPRLVLVEWPERLGGLARPSNRLEVTLTVREDPTFPEDLGGRIATLTGFGAWRDRIRALEVT